MTASNARTGDKHDNFKSLQALFARTKRRAWLLVGVQSLLHAILIAGTCAVLLAPLRTFLGIETRLFVITALIVALTITTTLMLRRRKQIPAYLHRVDDHFDAAGRIVSAAEFIHDSPGSSPFHTLALADTAKWVSSRASVRLPWTWPTRWAAFCVALSLLAPTACQKPEQRVEESKTQSKTGKIKVEHPDPGDHLTTTPTPPPASNPPGSNGSNGSSGMFGPPAERPGGVTYGTQQLQADGGGSSRGGSGFSANSSNAKNSATSNNPNSSSNAQSPSSTNNGGAGTNPGPSGRQMANRTQTPGQSAPQAPPGGTTAGRGPGQKLSDPRGVSAARKDVAANAKKGEGNSGDGNKRPGDRKPGKEFADGGNAQTTQPADDVNLNGVELDELAIERLPPEQRERIRQYNANLRKLRQTTKPHGS